MPFAARNRVGSLSQAAVRAAAGMLHLLQQHKTLLPQKAFAMHSSGAIPDTTAPHAPLNASGPMAAAAAMGVLKGLPFELPTMSSAPVNASAVGQLSPSSQTQLVVAPGRFDPGRCAATGVGCVGCVPCPRVLHPASIQDRQHWHSQV